MSKHCIHKDVGEKVPFAGCPRDPFSIGCSTVCELTLHDISSDAEVQPARAAVL